MKIIEVVSSDQHLDEGWASNLMRRGMRRAFPRISAHSANIYGALKSIWWAAGVGTLAYVLLKPFQDYQEQMNFADQYLHAKDPNERWSVEYYEKFHRAAMAKLISDVAVLWATHFLLKLPVKVISWRFGNGIMTITRPGRLWLADQISYDSEVAKAVGAYIFRQVDKENPMIDSQLVTRGENIIRAAAGLEERPSSSTSADDQTSQTKGQQPKSPSTDSPSEPADNKFMSAIRRELERLGPYNASDWTFYDPYHSKHVKTGKIFPNVELDLYKRGM